TANLAGHTQRHFVLDDRHIHSAFIRTVVLGAEGAADIATKFISRRFRSDYNRATESIATEQRTLWPFEDLDVGDVESRDVGARARQCHVCKVGYDRRNTFTERNARQTAHYDVVGRFTAFRAETKARNYDVKILNFTYVALVERVCRKRGHRERYRLRAFIALTRGYEYFFQAAVLCERHWNRRGESCDAKTNRQCGLDFVSNHLDSPTSWFCLGGLCQAHFC